MQRRGRSGDAEDLKRRKNSEIWHRRARCENGASVQFLSLRYLKIRYLKRYVGGLVYFDGSTSVYRALREWLLVATDDGVSASLFDGLSITLVIFSTSNGEKRLYYSVSSAGRCAEVRRQGHASNCIST